MFRFELGGGDRTLTAYRLAGAGGEVHESLFVPFLDATSGTETYGAGRYLDLEPEDDGTWTLDFNLAYHPSCVYDPRFSCPLTPAENRLAIRVEAGERLGRGPLTSHRGRRPGRTPVAHSARIASTTSRA